MNLFDDFRHGIGFAATGHAEERLVVIAAFDACGKLGNGFGLIAGWFEWSFDFKCGHELLSLSPLAGVEYFFQ